VIAPLLLFMACEYSHRITGRVSLGSRAHALRVGTRPYL
jgi:hypothetical protein